MDERFQYLTDMIDYCTKMQKEAASKGDVDMLSFWGKAGLGFAKKQ